ncbi:MAG: OmpH family outer membrane protein [Ruegeria sp.]
MNSARCLLIAQGPLRALCVILALLAPLQALSQQLGVPQRAILTISSDRLFSESAFGRRVIDEIEADGAVLAAENERIIAQLSKEERELTARRAEMEPSAFRALADAFDAKVQSHRESQKAKLDALAARTDEARGAFLEMVQPVLARLMQETGAGVILERSNVFFSANATDITDLAISRIDAAIGDGKGLENRDTE